MSCIHCKRIDCNGEHYDLPASPRRSCEVYLCPPHQSIAHKLSKYPQRYGCPQCAVNNIVELEEVIIEMWGDLPDVAKMKWNGTEVGRNLVRGNGGIDETRY